MHWIAKYVGLPYRSGGRDETGIDCWGLVFLVYPREFGIAVPVLPGVSANSALGIHRTIVETVKQDWLPIEKPIDGCVVTMSQKTAEHHVGLWVDADGGKVVHSWKGQSVIADTLLRLRLKGIRNIKYYKHRLWTGLNQT